MHLLLFQGGRGKECKRHSTFSLPSALISTVSFQENRERAAWVNRVRHPGESCCFFQETSPLTDPVLPDWFHEAFIQMGQQLKGMTQLCQSYISHQEVNLSLRLHPMDLNLGEECQCHGKGRQRYHFLIEYKCFPVQQA